ncbi:hypothetical protein MMC17_004944 [Xylographa soralifera]|nr:hypothetical protein [Xylographa soralifera]
MSSGAEEQRVSGQGLRAEASACLLPTVNPAVAAVGKETIDSGETETSTSLVRYDRGLKTRAVCVAILLLSWLVSVGIIAWGIYIWIWWNSAALPNGSLPYLESLTEQTAVYLSLAVSIAVTVLNESLGHIHAASLKWSLQRDSRLVYNTNLRLMSSSRTSKANRWYSNTVVLICTILTYSSSSMMFLTPASNYGGASAAEISFPASVTAIPIAILGLGFGVLGQAVFATWGLLSSQIPTWSTNPITTVQACEETGSLQRVRGRCMLDVTEKSSLSNPQQPKSSQPSMLSSNRASKLVLVLLWALVPLSTMWGAVVLWAITSDRFADATIAGSNLSLVPSTSAWSGNSPMLMLNWSGVTRSKSISSLISFALISTIQSILTLALHCAELLVNLSRDEVAWRAATSRKGSQSSTNSIIAACTSWQTAILFLVKALSHWVFGLGVKVQISNSNGMLFFLFRPVQIFYLTFVIFLFAILATYMSMRRPKGPQPAAYGHLQTLADLIDEWSLTLYWGHKTTGDVCHAGTSPKPLETVRMHCSYS